MKNGLEGSSGKKEDKMIKSLSKAEKIGVKTLKLDKESIRYLPNNNHVMKGLRI